MARKPVDYKEAVLNKFSPHAMPGGKPGIMLNMLKYYLAVVFFEGRGLLKSLMKIFRGTHD